MFKSIAAIVVCLLPFGTKGQTYFEGLYGDSETASGIGSNRLVHFGEGYLVWSNKFNFESFRFSLWSFTVDMEGNLTNEIVPGTPDSISEQAGKLIAINDTLIVGISQQRVLSQSSSEQGDIVLTCLSPQGLIHWRKVYGLPERTENPSRFIHCSDGGYAISGQVVLPQGQNGNGMVYLIKTDSLGNQLWERMYGGSLFDAGNDIVQTPDGGFLVLGWTRSFGAGQRDWYLVKTDSLGNQQWQRTYGGTGRESGACIIPIANGNYLLSGGGTDDGVTSRGQHYEVTPSGDVVWHEKYASGPSPKGYFFQSIQLPDGSIVSCGVAENSDTGGNAGWILKTTATGELLWQRIYDKNEFVDLFYTMLATDDGGFLLGGQAWNEETNSQDAWLLKVDSIGCPYPNCLVGVDEAEPTKVVADVWPNPCTDVLNLELSGNSSQLDVQVLDIQGREVLRHTQREQRATLDVSRWPSGIYILRGTDGNGRSFNLKVVKP